MRLVVVSCPATMSWADHSVKTAGSHVDHIYTKIGVNNRAMASLFAAKHGLISMEKADLLTVE
jgi:hypothetical protein